MTEVDPARGRFLVLQAVRFSGVALAVAGAATIAGKLPLPELVGYALLFAGIVDALVIPVVLTRAWKTPRP
jgi:hypothetical protein